MRCLAVLIASLLISGCSVQPGPTSSGTAQQSAEAVTPIFADQPIFMVLERIDGDKLTFRVLRSVSSHDSKTILWVGDEVRAVLQPLTPDGTRRAACVTDLLGRDGRGVIRDSLRSDDCLGQVADYRGMIGLEVEKIAPELVATLSLAGDLSIVRHASDSEGERDE